MIAATRLEEKCPYTPRIGEIESILRAGFLGLKFPRGIEQAYQRQRDQQAAHAFRYRSIFIFFLYLLLCTGIYRMMPGELVQQWLRLYGSIAFIILFAGILSRIPRLDPVFQLYAGIGSLLAVAVSVAVTGILPHGAASQLTHTAIMYAIIIIYSIVGLSFRMAMLAGWGGGVLGLLMVAAGNGAIDWEVAHRSYTGSSLLGMLICYLIEHASRRVYLQEQLLILANQRSEDYALQLKQLSHTDALTGLANRHHFSEQAENDWRRCQREGKVISIMMIDIDHFKHFNDWAGHLEGDRCLTAVAKTIASFARRASDLAVRYGGEEFLLWLPGTSPEDAGEQADQLRRAIQTLQIAVPGENHPSSITASIGVASMTPKKSGNLLSLIGAADNALYQAKAKGRDRVILAAESVS